MNFAFRINTLLPLFALLISMVLAVRALRYTSRRVSVTFVFLMLAVSWWSLASMMENSGLTLATKIFWLKMAYPAVVSIPLIWLIFTVQFSGGSKWLTRRNVAILAILPVLTLVMVSTNSITHLMWKSIWLDTSVSPAVDAVSHGEWFWVHAAYSYAFLVTGMLYLVRAFRNSSGTYRKQSGMLVVAALAPWAANILFLAGIGPFATVDPTPFAFDVTGIALLYSLSRLQLLDIIPIARDEIFKSMVDGVIVLDNRQRIVDINPAALSIIELSRASAIGRPYNVVMPGPARFIEFKPNSPATQAEIAIGENERQRYYRMNVSPIKIVPNVTGHLILLSDDTKNRCSEVEARETTRLQAELSERDKYAGVIRRRLDFEQTIARLSSRFVGLFAMTETINVSLADIMAFSKANCVYLFLTCASGIKIDGMSQWFAAGDGRNIQHLDELARDANSWWVKRLGNREFIAARHVAEMPGDAALEKGILENAGVDSVLVSPLFINAKLAGFMGLESTGGRRDWKEDDFNVLRMSSEIISNAIERHLATENLDKLIEELRALNSQLEEKVAERTKQLARALDVAETSSKTKSEFLASMSHELRTPLNAVIGFSQILYEKYFGDLNEKQAEYVADIMESGKHLLSLINDILDLSKIEAGKMEFEMAPVHLAGLLRNSLVMVKERALIHNISLEVMVEEIEGLMIRGDERRLKQVMFNLLSNAVKFTPDGGCVTIAAHKNNSEALISVTDTGIGITTDEQKHMFEAFYQASGGLRDKTPGTGLGLPITRNIIEKHAGRIWVESAGQNLGSKFTFTLQLAGRSLTGTSLNEAGAEESKECLKCQEG